MDLKSLSVDELSLIANTIRVLSAEGVEEANSGHPGMPMGMSELATVLWLKYLTFHPKDPEWIRRDRFVLSNGHGSMLLYTMLHLSGYDLSLDDLRKFRQWESKTPGHPEAGVTKGVEATTGPLGQGISNAVGMALGQRVMQTRHFSDSPHLLEGKVFVFCGDGDLMEGVSSEASSLAGHWGLNNLVVLYDDNKISIAGHTELAFTEDVLKRYEAYGWSVQQIDGHDVEQIDQAIETALKEKDRPTLIAAQTLIGKGSPNKANTHGVHGAPLGKEELSATKEALSWSHAESFVVPPQVSAIFARRIEELAAEYERWQGEFQQWKEREPARAQALSAQLERKIPEDLEAKLLASLQSPPQKAATRKLSGDLLQVISQEVPSLIGGSADLEPSTLTVIKGSPSIQRGNFHGKNIHFGVREHGMGSIINGLSYFGGYIPYGSTFLCFADYMRPTIRVAALSHLQSLFIFTHDTIFLGEDGPTHQPIEHLASLRVIPNLTVFRPADGVETALCYALALRRKGGPSAFALTRQNLSPIERPQSFLPSDVARGGYTVFESFGGGSREPVVFVATGSEVPLAIAAAKELSKEFSTLRVVSMPCTQIYRLQERSYRETLLPPSWNRVVIEAASTFGWLETVEGSPSNTEVIGIDHFGASAPAEVLAEKFGFTVPNVVERVRRKFS